MRLFHGAETVVFVPPDCVFNAESLPMLTQFLDFGTFFGQIFSLFLSNLPKEKGAIAWTLDHFFSRSVQLF